MRVATYRWGGRRHVGVLSSDAREIAPIDLRHRHEQVQSRGALALQLLTLSDRDWISTYCILDSTIPLYRYVATVRLKRVSDGDRTFWHWESTFATPPGRERELTEQVGHNVYEAGFDALRKYLE